jgi:hypothetical protein
MASCSMKQEGPRLVCLSVHLTATLFTHALVTRTGDVVDEGGVEEEEGEQV